MIGWLIFISTISALWVFLDATKHNIGPIDDGYLMSKMSAKSWAIATFLTGIPFLVLYLIRRPGLIDRAKYQPTTVEWRRLKAAIIPAAGAVIFIALEAPSPDMSEETLKSFYESSAHDILDSSSGAQPSENEEWNMSDANASSNGNIAVAAKLLNARRLTEVAAEDVDTIQKTPWKYYGKLMCFSGRAAFVQDEPPGGFVSNLIGGGEVGDLVIQTDNDDELEFLVMGGSGSLKFGSKVKVCGLTAGRVEAEGALGRTYQRLLFVANSFYALD